MRYRNSLSVSIPYCEKKSEKVACSICVVHNCMGVRDAGRGLVAVLCAIAFRLNSLNQHPTNTDPTPSPEAASQRSSGGIGSVTSEATTGGGGESVWGMGRLQLVCDLGRSPPLQAQIPTTCLLPFPSRTTHLSPAKTKASPPSGYRVAGPKQPPCPGLGAWASTGSGRAGSALRLPVVQRR